MDQLYTHHFLCANPVFLPSASVVRETGNLLKKWGLVRDDPTVYSLDKNNRTASLAGVPESLGHGVEVHYQDTDSGDSALEVMGPAVDAWGREADDGDEEERESAAVLIDGVQIVAGSDFRVYDWEPVRLNIVKPALNAQGHACESYRDLAMGVDGEEGIGPLGSELEYNGFIAQAGDLPPVISFEMPENADYPESVAGLLRSPGAFRLALILDCGFTTPAFALEGNRIPNRAFVAELERIWGNPVIEVGGFV